jgi:hypothetical protein
MRDDRSRILLVRLCLIVSWIFLSSNITRAQNSPHKVTSVSSPENETTAMSALADSIRDLQDRVRILTSELDELRASQRRAQTETSELRAELQLTKAQLTSRTVSANGLDSSSLPQEAATVLPASSRQTESIQVHPVAERLAKIEETQELMNAKINEQSQTKVESGSKYRVRLSGMILLNLFGNQGAVDNLDFPHLAFPSQSSDSQAFGGSLRQSQIGIDTFGPDIGGAHTSANVTFDFAGGFASTQNGVSMGLVRLRTGTVRMDWGNTSVVAGQDYLFFAPLAPTSVASLAIPELSYAGNLWSWTPQVRIEHRVQLSDASRLLFEGGILDSFTGEIPAGITRAATFGEESGQPGYAGRVAWGHHAFGRDLTFGVGGYYGRLNLGFGRSVDSWAGIADVTLPIGRFFDVTGEFYRGRAVGGLSGGIGQTILLSGQLADPRTVIRGLDSVGGWIQLKFKPSARLEFNGAVGQDNPFASELRRFPATQNFYGVLWSRNLSPFVNIIYHMRSDVLFSVEYRRLQTSVLDSGSSSANHVSLTLGYLF